MWGISFQSDLICCILQSSNQASWVQSCALQWPMPIPEVHCFWAGIVKARTRAVYLDSLRTLNRD